MSFASDATASMYTASMCASCSSAVRWRTRSSSRSVWCLSSIACWSTVSLICTMNWYCSLVAASASFCRETSIIVTMRWSLSGGGPGMRLDE
jgi:hypothetical protein